MDTSKLLARFKVVPHEPRITTGRQATVILGAGASKILGFPLQDELIRFFRRYTGLRTRMPSKKHLGDRDWHTILALESRWGTNIEDAMTILEHAIENRDPYLANEDMPGEILYDIVDLIQRTFGKVVLKSSGIALYRQFLETVFTTHDHCNFVSLNWDTGLEEVLASMRIGHDYGIMFDGHGIARFASADRAQPRDRFQRSMLISKPHGSLNWSYCRSCRALLENSGWKFGNGLKRSVDQALIRACPVCGTIGSINAVIIPPSHNKRVRLGADDHLFRKVFHQLRSADTLVFVGYSFREADYDLRYLLASALQARAHPRLNPTPRMWGLDLAVFGDRESTKRVKDFIQHFGLLADIRFAGLGKLSERTNAIANLKAFLSKVDD